MNLAPIIDLLRQRIGLDTHSLGATVLSRAVAARMQVLDLTAPEAYAARLVSDLQEFQILLGDVVVPETWFFRGGEIFAYLAGKVADAVRLQGLGPNKELDPLGKGRPSPGAEGKRFRILSVPCSTGEEPYSLAIALDQAAVAPASWEIEAVDLSAEHIALARRARFSNFSFRQTPSALRDRYFQPVGGGWELDPRIRACVRFRQGNLLDPLFLASEGAFDLILCRNLFIYLHPEARRQALGTVARLLAAAGWLCTGHADPFELQDAGFTRTGPRSYFLYRRAADGSKVVKEEEVARWRGGKVVKEKHHPTTSPPHHLTTSPPRPVVSSSPAAESAPPVDLLARARQEADSGRLVDALASCQEHLARFGPAADLYSLMGAIHQARREKDEAIRCYQRALYLEPEHPEALTHLMLLAQEQGDQTQAERLRRRLERVAPGGGRGDGKYLAS
jgi:chemotaxis protein methyltransferase WspC